MALVAVASVATAFVVFRMGGDGEPVPVGTTDPPHWFRCPVGPGGDTVGPSGAAAAAAGGPVTVDVAGKVRRPGVATLPAGSRVVDALRRAGGARAGVDLSSLNLARVLVDGEQILVGRAMPAWWHRGRGEHVGARPRRGRWST